jgi:protein associated with RNAse G/E
MVQKKFLEILDIVKEFLLHNNNTQYEEAIQALILEVKDINVMLYEQIILLVQESYIQAV